MNDLTEFLLARIAEDEAAAREAAEASQWMRSKPPVADWSVVRMDYEGISVWEAGFAGAGTRTTPITVHMQRWDPARVLAECDAKRQLIKGLVKYMEEDYAPWNEDFLRLLALPYADRSDYRQEWKP